MNLEKYFSEKILNFFFFTKAAISPVRNHYTHIQLSYFSHCGTCKSNSVFNCNFAEVLSESKMFVFETFESSGNSFNSVMIIENKFIYST